MEFKLTVLGTSAATPAHGRGLAAHVVQHHNEYFLIDCGEGTQFQLIRYSVKFSKINTIFISHLHGDHIFGLIGLLMNYELSGRKTPLQIYSPQGLEPIINIQAPHGFGYEVVFHTTTPTKSDCIWESDLLRVYTIPLKHRVPCNGFLFVEREKLRNIKADMIKKYNIPFRLIPGIKAGKDLQLSDGTTILNEKLTNQPPLPRKFAYCSDTRYHETIIPFIKGVDLLYHEATFMHELLEKAEATMHTTALEAGIIAKKAACKKLLMGHFSSRYASLAPFLKEAKTKFEHSDVAVDGTTYTIAN